MPIAAVSPATAHKQQTRSVLILAEDPGAAGGLFATVEIPYENLLPGPFGARVRVIDYDASTGKLLPPAPEKLVMTPKQSLLKDPSFHAQNVYAIVMRTLARFEFALGRRVSWNFDGHHLFAAPHAFCDANAFYSKQEHGLFFGYFTDANGRTVFTCLSHDVIAHETTHALVDGLRERFTYPSSPDQAAFHEAISDVVALLSIFSIPSVVIRSLDLMAENEARSAKNDLVRKLVGRRWLTRDRLKESVLLGLGKEIGQALATTESDRRKAALRRSVALTPRYVQAHKTEFEEPHRRGEILVAAILNTFLDIWCARIARLGVIRGSDMVDRGRVAEDGAMAADHLLTMAIRALDYCASTDLLFGDYLSALLTADYEVQNDDSKFHYRGLLLANFKAFGIRPTSPQAVPERGIWESRAERVTEKTVRFDSLQHDKDEVFRFLWENQEHLRIEKDAFTKVISVRPCTRLSYDGFVLRETVAEYVQMLTVDAGSLQRLNWHWGKTKPSRMKPGGMPDSQAVTLYGGGSLIFDEFGRLKYHIRNRILNAPRQQKRLKYLWESGYFTQTGTEPGNFAAIHRLRWADVPLAAATKEERRGNYF